MQDATPPRRTALLAGLGLAGAIAAVGYGVASSEAHAAQLATRYTARLSFWLFMAVYLCGPLFRMTGWTGLRGAMRNRRGLGLAFAAAHFVHLAALTTYLVLARLPITITVWVGGFAYAWLLAMTATSSDAAVRRLGPGRWKRLHRAGLHVLWLVFVLTLLSGVLRRAEGLGVHLGMLGFALAALALRAAAFARQGFGARRPAQA